MKYLLLLLIVSSCSPKGDQKECRIVYRIGYSFIKLSINEDGNTTAIIGESNDLKSDRFRVDILVILTPLLDILTPLLRISSVQLMT